MKRVCGHVAFLLLTIALCLNARGIDNARIGPLQRLNSRDVAPVPPGPIVVPPSQYL
jgi:hypothetical protein